MADEKPVANGGDASATERAVEALDPVSENEVRDLGGRRAPPGSQAELALRASIGRLRVDLDDLGRQLLAVGGEKVDAAKVRIEENLSYQRDRAAASLEATIRERPVLSLSIAFATGVVMARLLERR